MDRAFLNWYTQSLGGILGLIACIWAYLNGDMAVYGHIFKNLDEIGIGGFIASYILIPLCIIITLLGAIESYSKNTTLSYLNKILIIATSLVGLLGSKIYFIIPSIFILFKNYSHLIFADENLDTEKANSDTLKDFKIRKISYDSTKLYNIPKSRRPNKNLEKTKYEMAVELLLKGADKNFICEITSLTLEELNSIEKKIN